MCDYNEISIAEWFKWPWREFKLDCKWQIRAMNDILQLLRLDIYDIKGNEDIISFQWDWLKKLATNYPIYSIKYRYLKWYSQAVKLPLIEECKNCGDCADGYKAYILYDVWAYKDLAPCQFSYCRDWKEINVNIPSGVSDWYIKYYKWFNLLTSVNDKIPVQSSLRPAIKYLMKIYYYELAWTLYQWDDVKAESRYNTIISKFKDKDFIKLQLLS